MNIFKKNNILIDGLLSDTFSFLQSTYNQTASMFTVASAWGQILFVLQNLSQMILYFIEDSITELNMDQATRDHSIRSLARIAGYDPGRACAAQGEVSISWNKSESDVGGSSVRIENYTQIRCQETGKTYSLIFGSKMVTVPLSASSDPIRVKIAQGEFLTANVTGTGNALQSYNLPSSGSSYIDQFYVDVYVNEEKWRRYDSFYDMPLNGKAFMVRSGIQDGIDIYFGNSNFGMIPPSGSLIRIMYLLTGGVIGNATSTKEKPLTYKFVSSGTDLFSQEVNLNNYLNVTNLIDPAFGNNPESLNLIRLVAPKTSRSFVFANAQNYEIFLNKLGLFSQIQAFSTFDDDYLDDDNIVYLFLVPDATLSMTSNEDYFDIPLSNFLLTTTQKNRIVKLIEDTGSMIATTVVKIVEPIITRYIANVIITIFEGYDPETIKQSIRNNISDYMINLKRRDLIPKSDMIALIEGIEGVDSVSFYFVSEANETGQMKPSKSINPGLNTFGDIVISRNELPVIRGGWKDKNGILYQQGIINGKPCALNIAISNIVPLNFNSALNTELKSQIINRSK